MKSKIITIAGALGSGKSSTAKLVAKERGLTVEQINEAAELEQEIDHAVDERLKEMGKGSDLVIDSRLAFHWMPNSFKVYLKLDSQQAAERIFNHIQKEGRESQSGDSVEEIFAETERRKASEKKRYMNLYSVDVHDMTPFDVVIDTGPNDLPTVAQMVTDAYREWLEQ